MGKQRCPHSFLFTSLYLSFAPVTHRNPNFNNLHLSPLRVEENVKRKYLLISRLIFSSFATHTQLFEKRHLSIERVRDCRKSRNAPVSSFNGVKPHTSINLSACNSFFAKRQPCSHPIQDFLRIE